MGEAYGKRPSEIMGFETPWGAWQLDQLTLIVGRQVERNLNNGKEAFHGFGHTLAKNAKFSSAKHLAMKKIKIKADGTW